MMVDSLKRLARSLAACVIAAASLYLTAHAEPVLKVINFTADWCPNCQILNPRIAEAVSAFDEADIEIVNLDMTNASRRNSEIERTNAMADAMRLADANQVGYLWDWYGGVTGIAAVVAADTGEPITCLMRPLRAGDMQKRLRLAKILVEKGTPGRRKPEGPECPAPR